MRGRRDTLITVLTTTLASSSLSSVAELCTCFSKSLVPKGIYAHSLSRLLTRHSSVIQVPPQAKQFACFDRANKKTPVRGLCYYVRDLVDRTGTEIRKVLAEKRHVFIPNLQGRET
mgnify:CR=1 FL=1